MRIEGLGLNNEEVLDRICEAYGFSQKIQLARHFEIASSSLAKPLYAIPFLMTLLCIAP
jgi:hypothetical protein